MPDTAEILLRLLGAFYMFAGVVAARAALTSRFADTVIAAIDGSRTPLAERRKSAWLIGAAAIVFAGGLVLALGIDAARWLFLASAAGQALYLFALAPGYFDKADAPDAQGRRQTTNAFVVYVAATALVWWGAATGKLAPLAEAHPAVLAAAAAGIVAYLGYIARHTIFGLR